ncbi:MAG TPA: hypothetical protein VEZ47_03155, partial [Gemmatirosa sp.]|nr:hypothetical protein [Gemmatirosa sp.]
PVELLFYKGRFADHRLLIPLFGMVPVLAALTVGYSVALRAVQRPQHYLVAGLVSGPVGFATALVFIRAWGLEGAAASVLTSHLASFAVTVFLFSRWVPRATTATSVDRD